MESSRPRRFLFGVRCRVGRLMSIVITGSLVALCIIGYILRFSIPMLDGEERYARPLGISSLVIISVLGLFVLTSFFRTALTHPGPVPSFLSIAAVLQLQREVFQIACTEHVRMSQEDAEVMLAAMRVGTVDSTAIPATLRRCDVCQVFKIERVHHCSSCGECIYEMDHHCPWFGLCIGKGNHKFFILFLGYTTLGCLFIVATAAIKIFRGSFLDDIALLVVWFAGLVFALLLGPFCWSSVETVHANTSTIEKMRGRQGGTRGPQPSSSSFSHAAPLAEGETKGLGRIMGTPEFSVGWLLPCAGATNYASRQSQPLGGSEGGGPSLFMGSTALIEGNLWRQWLLEEAVNTVAHYRAVMEAKRRGIDR